MENTVMKLKYLFGAILSVVLLAACSDDDTIGNLDTIELDQTFLSIPMEGGQATVTIKTSRAWQFDAVFEKITTVDGVKDTTYTQLPNSPEWLTASQLSGEGETKVTFTAGATNGGRETELCILAGGKKQFLIVRQGSLEASEATCKDVIEGPDGKSYRVSGVVTSIANTHYGNFYMNDGTSDVDVYVYGTNDKNGKKGNDPIDGEDGWGFEVGDIITVEGPKQLYGTTVELVDVTVVKIVKSLLKIASTPATVAKEGGEVVVKVAYKGNGAFVQIPDDAKSWVSYIGTEYVPGEETIFEPNPADTAVFKFNVAENGAAVRTAVLQFQSFSGEDESSIDYTITQLGGITDVPVSDFLAAEVGEAQYRLTGVITGLYSSDKQGKSFYIRDYSGETLIYRVEGFIEAGAKVGDVVTVVGQRGAYKDSPQMVSGQFESLDHVVTEVTIAEFLAKEPATDVYYRISGRIDRIANATYGNVDLTDETGTVYVYGCYPGWGATGDFRKNLFEKLGIAESDKLSVIGVRAEYNGPQLGNGIYFSHEKAE